MISGYCVGTLRRQRRHRLSKNRLHNWHPVDDLSLVLSHACEFLLFASPSDKRLAWAEIDVVYLWYVEHCYSSYRVIALA
jgi:hypothetical protein